MLGQVLSQFQTKYIIVEIIVSVVCLYQQYTDQDFLEKRKTGKDLASACVIFSCSISVRKCRALFLYLRNMKRVD